MDNKKTPADRPDNLCRPTGAKITRDDSPLQHPLSSEQMQQMFHELRLQQVELENQNEELRRTQRKLEESRARYFELYDLAPVGYLTLDADGLILEANLTAVTMLGMPRRTLLKQPLSRFFLPEDQDIYYLERTQLYATITPQSWDMRMLNSAGDIFWAHLQATPAHNGECRITLEDISNRKLAENIMESNLRLSEYAINHSLDELLTKVIDEAEAITGSTIGFFHFLESDQVTLKLQTWSTNTLKTMCTAEGKGQHYSVDKAGVWVECIHVKQPVIHNSYPRLQNRKGLPEGHAPVERELVVPVFRGDRIVAIIGVGNKPSDYLEQDIEAVSRLLNFTWDIVSGKQATEELGLFFNLVPDMVCIISIDGYFKKINKAWEAGLGFPEEELLATPFKELVHPDDVRNTLDVFDKQLVAKEAAVFNNRFRCKDGSYRLLEWVSAPAVDTNLFAVARDVTDLRRPE